MSQASAERAIAAPLLFDGEDFLREHGVVIRGATIVAVLPLADCPDGAALTRLSTGTLTAGFIDLQANGGGDVLFNNAPTVATLEIMLAAHRRLGTTALLPTVVSDTPEVLRAALAAVSAARAAGQAGVLGIHLEGPFLEPSRRGAHGADHLRAPASADLDWLCEARDFPVLLTLAPGRVAPADIARLSRAGVIVCAGHSEASYEDMVTAAAHGLAGVTHLFNAMSQLQARQPGVVGAALDLPQLWAGIIADGHHVHPAAIRLAHAAKPPGGLLLVSDAMATVGGRQRHFSLYGETISERDGCLVNAAGTLAGSAIALSDAVRYAHREVGLPLADCLRMASLYPATAIGLGARMGRLAAGYRADLVHLDDALRVRQAWVAGAPAAMADSG